MKNKVTQYMRNRKRSRGPETDGGEPVLSQRLLYLLTVTTALAVGNVYYSQPLLGEIGREFHENAATMGLVPMLTQFGYVLGLVFVTPLGDVLEKRCLVASMLVLASLSLLAAAASPDIVCFASASFAIGVTAVLVQVLIPFVAALSPPLKRGGNLGVIIGGALIGILLSRTLSGFIGSRIGWRGMFATGSGAMLILAGVLAVALPRHRTSEAIPYPKLILSVYELFRDLPEVRAISLTAGLMYAALSAFWATLAFYLQSDAYRMGPEVAGAFGLVGVVGALAASMAGRRAQQVGVRRLVQGCIGSMLLAYVLFLSLGGHFAGMVAGVILLDLGAQAATASNQLQLYAIHPAAPTRLNTIYKVYYFAGGALGSALAAVGWEHFGWAGVCGVGGGLLLAALIWEKTSTCTRKLYAGVESAQAA
jgi:predicted MFS family arabinose efflux permease